MTLTTRARRTPAAPVAVSGVGIHTGASAEATVLPAPFGAGVVFRSGSAAVAASPGSVTDTSRCTVLGRAGVTVSTVEHLLSAFAGLGVTDAVVEVEGPELPIGDGGSRFWVEALLAAGLSEGGSPVTPTPLPAPLLVTGKGGSFIAAYPSDVTRFTVAISFEHPLVGTQVARFEPEVGDYAADVAPARTFGFIEEVQALLDAGLARGGSLDNAVVVYPDRYSTPLRFPDELARHKLLDLMGDLWLACAAVGGLPAADIIAVKPSHRLNVAFASRLADLRTANEV